MLTSRHELSVQLSDSSIPSSRGKTLPAARHAKQVDVLVPSGHTQVDPNRYASALPEGGKPPFAVGGPEGNGWRRVIENRVVALDAGACTSGDSYVGLRPETREAVIVCVEAPRCCVP